MSAVVLPLTPARVVRVSWDFDGYRVTLVRRGRTVRRFGALYDDLGSATLAAERVRRIEAVPSAPIIEPRAIDDGSAQPVAHGWGPEEA